MRKFFISILIIVFAFNSNFVKSQLPNGSIAPDWTLVDINGTSHHLYDYLNAGKTVVIDFSAVWCGPCWSYHNSGALENFYTQHGPGGDNKAMVFFIEGDQGTVAQLNGGSGSQGNWVSGTPYPIIATVAPNGSSVVSAYQIGYFPTCYMICAADKKTKLVDQYTTSQLNTALGTCPSLNVAPVANFTASATTSCAGTISFTDISSYVPTSWLWTFGDGQTSTVKNPTHTYTSSGTFTVSLKATNAYGNNTITKNNYITISLPSAPATTDGYGNAGSSVTLQATGAGTLKWYNVPSGGTSIFTGNTYVTPPLTTTTSYYVEDNIFDPVQSAGMPAKTSNGAYYVGSAEQGLVFNALKPLTIQSVTVYASSAASRTIFLKNSSGTILDSLTTNISNGTQSVTLNFDVPAGTGYVLGASSYNSLWRETSGAVYPYTLSGILSITGNTAGSSATAYYYYFYNWQVKGGPCISSRATATANIATEVNEIDIIENFSLYPNPNTGKFILFMTVPQENEVTVSIFNITGENIFSDIYYNPDNLSKKFDFSDFSKGVYFLKIITKNEIFYKKFIIE